LTRQLSSGFQLPYLKISQLNGAALHEQEKPETGIGFARWALARFGLSLDPLHIRDELHNLSLEFSPPLQALLRQLQWQSLLLSLTSALLVLLPFYRYRGQQQRKSKHSLHPME